jgi:hypothetical protein
MTTVEYEFRFTYRVSVANNPRASIDEKDVSRVLTPFLFPRQSSGVAYVGSTVQRVDHLTTTSTRSDTVSEPPSD